MGNNMDDILRQMQERSATRRSQEPDNSDEKGEHGVGKGPGWLERLFRRIRGRRS